MSISSLNSASAGAASFYSKSTDTEYEEIKKKLQELGIEPTGNKEVDKAKLQKAEKEEAKQKEQEKKQNGQGEPPPELLSILNQLGLQPSGDIKTDCSNAESAIASKIDAAENENDKAKYQNLKTDLEQFKANDPTINSSIMLGASALANLNRKMIGQWYILLFEHKKAGIQILNTSFKLFK